MVQEKKIDKFCDKIVAAIGMRKLNELNNQSALYLEQRLLALLCLHQGNVASISLREIQINYSKVKNQDLGISQFTWDNNNIVMDYL